MIKPMDEFSISRFTNAGVTVTEDIGDKQYTITASDPKIPDFEIVIFCNRFDGSRPVLASDQDCADMARMVLWQLLLLVGVVVRPRSPRSSGPPA